jgi:hypothetical protein
MTQKQTQDAHTYAELVVDQINLGLISLEHGCNLIVQYITEMLGKATADELNSILSYYGLPLFGLIENESIYRDCSDDEYGYVL